MKPIVLIITDYYLPGYKAGGPIRSISNIVSLLGDTFTFRILTRDRDISDRSAYSGLNVGTWQKVGNAEVMYLAPDGMRPRKLWRLIQDTAHDVLYLNSVFSHFASIIPLIGRWVGRIPRKPCIVAPNGEFSRNALLLRPFRKRGYLLCARLLRFFDNVSWHATSRHEEQDVHATIGSRAQVTVARALPTIFEADALASAKSAVLRLVFLSRINPMKNLDYALKVLLTVKAEVQFDIFGVIEDQIYWDACRELMEKLPSNVSAAYRGVFTPEQTKTILPQYDICFLPSRGENYGHIIVEALCANCPVLISDKTPWRNLNELNIGWDITLDSPEQFTNAIDELAAKPAKFWQDMKESIRLFVKEEIVARMPIEENKHLFLQRLAPISSAGDFVKS